MKNFKITIFFALTFFGFSHALSAMDGSVDEERSPGHSKFIELYIKRLKWGEDDSEYRLRWLVNRTSIEILNKLESLIEEECPPSDLEGILELLKNPKSIRFLDMSIEIGEGKDYLLKDHRELTEYLSKHPIPDHDFRLIMESFKNRVKDRAAKLIKSSIEDLYYSTNHEEDVKRIQIVGQYCNNFPDGHTSQILLCLRDFSSEWYETLLLKWQEWRKEEDWSEVKVDEIGSLHLKHIFKAIMLRRLTDHFPDGLQPSSWERKPLTVNHEKLPPQETPVGVFDIDDCVFKYISRRINDFGTMDTFQRFIAAHPHSPAWLCFTSDGLANMGCFIPYFDVVLSIMITKRWRIAYFSAGSSDRNTPLIDDTHRWFFGEEAYQHLQAQEQFKVFSDEHRTYFWRSEGSCERQIYVKDLGKTLLLNEKIENSVLFEDKVGNCANEGHAIRFDVEQSQMFNEDIPGGFQGAAACLIGLVLEIDKLDSNKPLPERVRMVQQNGGGGVVPQLYKIGCVVIRAHYPDADLGEPNLK